jgi:hypothetical protein
MHVSTVVVLARSACPGQAASVAMSLVGLAGAAVGTTVGAAVTTGLVVGAGFVVGVGFTGRLCLASGVAVGFGVPLVTTVFWA